MGIYEIAHVTPAKKGFWVKLWYGVPGQTPNWIAAGTNSAGEVKFGPWDAPSYPIEAYFEMAAQTVDGIDYGAYITETQMLYDGDTGHFYLYPEWEEPEPDQWWEYDSTYRGVEIQRWMPGAIAYGAWIDDDWIVRVDILDLHGLIDDWLGPEEEPPVDGDGVVVAGIGGIGILILLWLILKGKK